MRPIAAVSKDNDVGLYDYKVYHWENMHHILFLILLKPAHKTHMNVCA